jgi:hypothetical protein
LEKFCRFIWKICRKWLYIWVPIWKQLIWKKNHLK